MSQGFTATAANRGHKLLVILNCALIAAFIANILLIKYTGVETDEDPSHDFDGENNNVLVLRRHHVLRRNNLSSNDDIDSSNSGSSSSSSSIDTSTAHNNGYNSMKNDLVTARRRRWIVVNLKALPSTSLKEPLAFLDDIRGWSKIIVDGPLTAMKHGCSTCLEMDGQSSLQSAFIMAMKHGAREMFIMTSLLDVRETLSRMAPSQRKGLVYSGLTPFKPCSHFVQPLFGTNRSFGECFDRNWVYSYHVHDFPERLIIGVCSECDQRSPDFESGRVYCDKSTPNVAVQAKSLSRSTFENSLWTYDSFWALFFYILDDASTSETESLKYSYMVQRLLWETHTSLAFVRSHDLIVKGHENSPKIILQTNDVIDKVCRVQRTPVMLADLVQSLQKWECQTNDSIIDCAQSLFEKLYTEKHLSTKQFQAVEVYLRPILSLVNSQPLRNALPDHSMSSYFASKAKAVFFWPAVRKRVWSRSPFHNLCSTKPDVNNSNPFEFAQASAEPRFGNIALVIVFMQNDPATHIQMAQYFDYLYGHHFRHIVYCAVGTEMIEMFAKMYPQPMTVINLNTTDPRLFSYTCVSETMKMYQDVGGYLQIDSRTLLNPWSINKLADRLDVPWLSQTPKKAYLLHNEISSPHDATKSWDVWNDVVFGKKKLQESVEDLIFISKMIDEHVNIKNNSIDANVFHYLVKYNSIVKRFLKHFDKASVGNSVVHYGQPSVFFVPSKYRKNFIVISEQCGRYLVHSDLVIPTLLKTLDVKGRVISLDGSFLRNARTSLITASFRPDSVYLFPWQMHMISSPTRSLFMCETFLPLLHQPAK